MTTPELVEEQASLWPAWTEEQLDERLIGQVFGNIRIEHPEITREQVAERLRMLRKAEAENATKR